MTALTQALMALRAQRDRYAAAVDALERLAEDTSADRPSVAAEPMAEAGPRPVRRYLACRACCASDMRRRVSAERVNERGADDDRL